MVTHVHSPRMKIYSTPARRESNALARMPWRNKKEKTGQKPGFFPVAGENPAYQKRMTPLTLNTSMSLLPPIAPPPARNRSHSPRTPNALVKS